MAENPSIVVRVATSCEIQAVQEIITGMQEQGFDLSLTSSGGLAVTPASRLDDHQRAMIRENRAAIMAHLTAANDPQPDPDRWAWPNGTAANSRELDLMATRLERFARIGMDVDQAEKLADKLLIRDREGDDRAMCLECGNLTGGAGNWRCMAFRQRGAHDPGLPADYTGMLTRCPTFQAGDPQAYGSFTTARPANDTRLVQRDRAQGPWLSASETAAALEYHQHHATCPQCQAAGRGYSQRCGEGAELWTKYQSEDGKNV